jgi:hypothetical protein
MIPYARGPYNHTNAEEQWIRLSEGCPNNCEFCRETKECGKDPIYFQIPEITRNKVKILDMNLSYKPRFIEILNELAQKRVNGHVVHYELICGIDFRTFTLEKANALKAARFKNIRLAWDFGFEHQALIKKTINMLVRARYQRTKISVFILCNWKIPHKIVLRKLDLLKIWNTKVSDCWFDNQISPRIKPIYWTKEQIIDLRGKKDSKCRLHNQMVGYGIDPNYKFSKYQTILVSQ